MNAMNDVAAAPDRPRGIDPHVAGPRWLPVIRRLLGYGVIVAVLPYLALKALWLGGVMVGVPEGSPARGAGFVGPNIVTALLDVVAIAVALALTHRWGRRLPAWLVLAPIWVGTGLLVPAVVRLVILAAAGAVAAGAVAAAHLVMAFGTQGAVTGADQPGWEYTARSGEVVNAAMAALAVAGIRGMIRRPDAGRRTPVWVAVALTWTGSGAMFAYALLTLLVVAAGVPESDNLTALNGLTQLAALLGGLFIAVTGVVNLAERRHAAVDPDERETP